MVLFKIAKTIIPYLMECKGAYLFLTGIAFLTSIVYGLQIWAIQWAFDTVMGLTAGERTFVQALMAILVFTGFVVGEKVLNGIYSYQYRVIPSRLHGFMCKKVAEKSAKLSPLLYEDPKILDEINKAHGATHLAFYPADAVVSLFTFHIPYFLVTAAYLYLLEPVLVFAIVFIFLPKIISLGLKASLYKKLEQQSAPLRREYEFYEEAMTEREFFKETRALGAYGYFKDKYLQTLKTLNKETWRTDSKSATIDLSLNLLTVLGYIGVLYLLFASLSQGNISVGAFAAVFGNIASLIYMVDGMITYNLGDAMVEAGKVEALIDFFKLPEVLGEAAPINWQGDISLKNVSFTYPNAQRASLNRLNLAIKGKETIAIVGENGAGKSTLTKVLLGLYPPTEGTLTVEGMDSKNVHPTKRYQGVSAVFQKYQRYQVSLKDNIQASAFHEASPIAPIMEKAGVEADPDRYTHGLDTILSREFDGIDLSGGQWQRIAIARGLYRSHHLIVLDEPTAAIDPIEESRLYEKFAEISQNKTAIIVTHRLASAQLADRILVMEDGQIVEDGNHQDLLANGGLYAKMYKSQEQWYMG